MEENPRNQRRSARVLLAVPLILVTENLLQEPVKAEAVTVAVNAHGGLLKVKAELLAGQPMQLINPQTNQRESCRTVRVETLPNGEFAVAFEFGRPAPEFWPISFPPTDWNLVPP